MSTYWLGKALIHTNECHFFINTIIMIRRNKMIDIFSRNFNTKVLFFILSNLLSFKIRGRHSTTAYSQCVLYNTFSVISRMKYNMLKFIIFLDIC